MKEIKLQVPRVQGASDKKSKLSTMCVCDNFSVCRNLNGINTSSSLYPICTSKRGPTIFSDLTPGAIRVANCNTSSSIPAIHLHQYQQKKINQSP